MIYAGIDAGSRAIKVVLWDTAQTRIMAKGHLAQGIAQANLARQLYLDVLRQAGVAPEQVSGVVATGYGRNQANFAHTTITEITCHARGVLQLAPQARTIIEIGGQDSKLIRLEATGLVRDFAMNDRCAAGTGRFLEMVATQIAQPVSQLGELARKSRAPASITSMCVVFAETEIIGLLASGTPPEDIVAGIQTAVAERIVAMAGRRLEEPVLFTGGVALVSGMDQALEAALGHPVAVVAEPLFTGALGAALLAASRAEGATRIAQGLPAKSRGLS